MSAQEGSRISDFLVVSLVPDICKSPGAPVPYFPVIAYLEDSISTASSVHFHGKRVSDSFTLKSRIPTLSGDEAGVGGGVISGVNRGWSRPINGSTTVFAEGSPLVWDRLSLFWMNCAGSETPGNTVGQLIGPSASPAASNPAEGTGTVKAETAAESGFLDSVLGPLGLDTSSLRDLYDWGKKAYELSQVDWSNPAGVLGAIGGLSGLPGLGVLAGVSRAASIAQMGYNLATIDWRDPAKVFGALGGIAGLAGLSDVAKLASIGGQGCSIAAGAWRDPAALAGSAGLASSAMGVGIAASPGGIGLQQYAIATTDWRNGGSIVSSAMTLAGSMGLAKDPPPTPESKVSRYPELRDSHYPKTAPPPNLLLTPVFTPIGASDPRSLARLPGGPQSGVDIRCDPILLQTAARNWRPIQVTSDPSVCSSGLPGTACQRDPVPPIVPETRIERSACVAAQLFRPIPARNSGEPDLSSQSDAGSGVSRDSQ